MHSQIKSLPPGGSMTVAEPLTVGTHRELCFPFFCFYELDPAAKEKNGNAVFELRVFAINWHPSPN